MLRHATLQRLSANSSMFMLIPVSLVLESDWLRAFF